MKKKESVQDLLNQVQEAKSKVLDLLEHIQETRREIINQLHHIDDLFCKIPADEYDVSEARELVRQILYKLR